MSLLDCLMLYCSPALIIYTMMQETYVDAKEKGIVYARNEQESQCISLVLGLLWPLVMLLIIWLMMTEKFGWCKDSKSNARV